MSKGEGERRALGPSARGRAALLLAALGLATLAAPADSHLGRCRPPFTPKKTAAAIAAEFRRLAKELVAAADELAPLRSSDPAAYRTRALDLLDDTEAQADRVLREREYPELADWLRVRLGKARDALLGAGAPAGREASGSAAPALALASYRTGPDPAREDPATDDWRTLAVRALTMVFVRAEQRCLDLELSFTIEGEGVRRASMQVQLRGVPGTGGTLIRANGAPQRIRIGSYSYEVTVPRRQPEIYPCDAETGGTLRQCPLDLVDNPVSVVECDFADSGSEECFYAKPYLHCPDPRP